MKYLLLLSILALSTANWQLTPITDISTHTITLYIGIKQHNINKLHNELQQRSTPTSKLYANWLTRHDILQITQPNPQPTINYLSTIIPKSHITNYNDAIKITTSISNIEQLFNTTMMLFTNTKTLHQQYAALTNYVYPHNQIDIVEGLHLHNNDIIPLSTQWNEGYIIPTSIHNLYNITNYTIQSQSSQTVGEFENDLSFTNYDMSKFTNLTTTPYPIIQPNHIIGPYYPLNPDGEATLDIQYQTTIAQNATQWYTSSPQWLFAYTIQMQNLPIFPLVHSISYGWNEAQQCNPAVFTNCTLRNISSEAYTKRTNIEFLKMGLMGMTIVVASGDSGSSSRSNVQCDHAPYLNPVFPASSPYVVTVGGTHILQPITTDKYNTSIPMCHDYNYDCIVHRNTTLQHPELNCEHDTCAWTSGSGISNYFGRPFYQDYEANHYFNTSTNLPPSTMYNRYGRIYPDVAMVANNFLIILFKDVQIVAGTSAAAPSFSALITLLNDYRLQHNLSPLGFVNPLLYEINRQCDNCFVDIQTGSSASTEFTNCKYGYEATRGFDPIYGLGTPNYGNIRYFIETN